MVHPTVFRDAAEYNFWNSVIQPACARILGISPKFRAKIIEAGQADPLWETALFVDWQLRVFGHRPAVYRRREKLWEQLAQRLDPSRPLVVLEFGVAWGYATNWWLRRLGHRNIVWHGFDRFTGLPCPWRGSEQGAFDAGGIPPEIEDERVFWHVGDIEETLKAVDLVAARDAQWLILFDLDIYEPTAFAWEAISAHLRPGDAIYFDEAMDNDERRVLNESVLPSIGCEVIGTTTMALGLIVNRPVQ